MYKVTVFLADMFAEFSTSTAFSYVPEYYLETMVDSFHALRRGVPPVPFTSDPTYRGGLMKIVTGFISYFNDSRIVNPGT